MGEVCLHYAGSHGIIKKSPASAGQKSPVTFMPLSTAEFFSRADFAFFHHRHYRHQADTTNPAISSAAKVPAQPVRPNTGVHRQSFPDLTWQSCHQSGKRSAFNTIGSANRFFRYKANSRPPINSCGPKTRKPNAKREARRYIGCWRVDTHRAWR